MLILFRVQMIRNQMETSRINAVRFFKHGPCQTAVFEHYEEIQAAIQREHNIEHGSRKWKVRLILANNPDWNDLYDSIT